MNPDRWQQVKKIFDAALEIAPEKRGEFLDENCAEDEILRREVVNLLASSKDDSFMEQPAATELASLIVERNSKLIDGEQIAHYRILSQIGAGGMGEVYLAQDTRLHRKIALKILHSALSDDQDRLRRFEQEAFAVSALNHPNILTIYEIGESDGTHFIAAEFIDGETLREKMRNDSLTIDEALDIAVQTAFALSAAHAAGIVHRDIKPENVMLRADGLVKVLDFGLVKLTKQQTIVGEDAARTLIQTNHGMIMGTAAYMSPEQARGKETDARTDIWSLGALLYEMLAGKTPFAGETASDVMASVLTKEPEKLSELNPGIPAELEQIVFRLLRKDRAERYETAKDLLVDLKKLQKRLEFEAELLRDRRIERRGEAESVTEIHPFPKRLVSSSHFLNSIAVLPFRNMSADVENEYFCDGLAEELINALAKIGDLKVAARTSAFSFKGKNINVGEVGRALGVKTVLEGSVRKSGNRNRIIVELVNAADGYHLWSERYDLEMKDIFDVQDEITLSVVDALKVKLLGKIKSAILKRYTDNPQAYELYLKGCFYRGKGGTESRKKAVECFQAAIAADPDYALAYAELSFSYRVLISGGTLDPQEFTPKVEAMALKALKLDETLAEAHFALACFKQDAWQWRAAESGFKRAVELDPNLARMHVGYAGHLSRVGRARQAVAQVKRAGELDPLSPIINANVGFILYFARRHDEAIETLKETLEIDSNFAFAHLYLGYNYAAKGTFTEAIAAYKEAIRLGQNTPSNQIYLGAAYAGKGEPERAQTILEQLLTGESYVSPGELAVLYAALNEREQAFAALEEAYVKRDLQLQYLSVDPAFDSLRDDPRFQDLVRRVGLPVRENLQDTFPNEARGARTVSISALTTGVKENSIVVADFDNKQMSERLPKANRAWLTSVSLGLLLIAAIGFGLWFSGNRPSDAAPIESIAVLPFVNASGNADMEYLSDGMTESLITSLSQLPKLSVKARSSVFRYKDKNIEPQKVGAELSVQAILSGRVTQRGEQLLLSIELADTKTGNALWTEQYNRKTTDLVALQSEIARDVSQKLQLRLSGAEERQVAKSYTENTEAYQLYLKGRFYWNKRTGDGLQKSVEYFNQAIEKDSNYALAFAGLAESYVIFSGYSVSPPQEAYPKAKAAAKRALEIDETLAEAHAALGLELFAYEWNAAESDREFQRAIELNPNYATAHHWYGNQNLLYTGRFDEAIAEMKRAQELDPLSLVINADLGDTYFYARQYDKAIEQLRKTIEMDAGFYYAHYELGMAYEMKGSFAEAVAQYKKARELNNDPRVLALLAHAYAASGKRDDALKMLGELKELARQRYVPAYNFAIAYAGLKENDQAFEWLEKSYQDRASRMTILQVDPFLDNLRADPRLADLVRRVGLLK